MTPFFQASHCSLAYQFTVNAPLLCPLFLIFIKSLQFQPWFAQNCSSLDPIFFPNFLSKDPHFSRKIQSLDPTFWNPCGTHPPKKKLSTPPPPHPPGIQVAMLGMDTVHTCHIMMVKTLSSLCGFPHRHSWSGQMLPVPVMIFYMKIT